MGGPAVTAYLVRGRELAVVQGVRDRLAVDGGAGKKTDFGRRRHRTVTEGGYGARRSRRPFFHVKRSRGGFSQHHFVSR